MWVATTGGTEKFFSVELYKKDDPLKSIIDKKDINIVREQLVNAYEEMVEISKNQQFHIESDQVHIVSL